MKKIVAAALAVTALSVLAPTPASASAVAPPAAPDARLTCSRLSSWMPAYSCYDRKYDNFWVYDGEKDGYSALVKWRAQTGGTNTCRNAKGVGTWKRCAHNLLERRPNGARNHVTWDEYRYDKQQNHRQLLTAPAGRSAT